MAFYIISRFIKMQLDNLDFLVKYTKNWISGSIAHIMLIFNKLYRIFLNGHNLVRSLIFWFVLISFSVRCLSQVKFQVWYRDLSQASNWSEKSCSWYPQLSVCVPRVGSSMCIVPLGDLTPTCVSFISLCSLCLCNVSVCYYLSEQICLLLN